MGPIMEWIAFLFFKFLFSFIPLLIKLWKNKKSMKIHKFEGFLVFFYSSSCLRQLTDLSHLFVEWIKMLLFLVVVEVRVEGVLAEISWSTYHAAHIKLFKNIIFLSQVPQSIRKLRRLMFLVFKSKQSIVQFRK